MAFAGPRLIASGELKPVALATKAFLARNEPATVLFFDAETSAPIEVDLRGTPEDVESRFPLPSSAEADTGPQRGPGRPKLGVVAREVTLLPRHWDWLNAQPGGASVALRKLVEEAARANADKDRMRRARESAYRFMTAMAGDCPGFEEASRALFAGDRERFEAMTADWPTDVRTHACALAASTFPAPADQEKP